MRLRFHPAALAEARAARRWYADRDPAAAEAFMAEMDRAATAIVDLPRAWPPSAAGTRRFLFKRFPYYVIYRELGDLIQVVAVMRAKRRPGYWRAR